MTQPATADHDYLHRFIQRCGYFHVEKLQIRVRVLNSRMVWGNVHVLIKPEAGEGEQWVSVDRVRLDPL